MRTLRVAVEHWPLKAPFRIAGYEFTQADLVTVALTENGITGLGEAAGVYYRGETPETMKAEIETVRGEIEAGLDREALRDLLPPGGARNALDCALWDLKAKQTGLSAWHSAGLPLPGRLATTYTIG